MLTKAEKTTLHQMLLDTRDEVSLFIEEVKQSTKIVELDEPIGRISRVDAMQQQQMALANRRSAKDRLKRVELALKRYEQGEYGICCECGEDISFKRLAALPESTFCIECKS